MFHFRVDVKEMEDCGGVRMPARLVAHHAFRISFSEMESTKLEKFSSTKRILRSAMVSVRDQMVLDMLKDMRQCLEFLQTHSSPSLKKHQQNVNQCEHILLIELLELLNKTKQFGMLEPIHVEFPSNPICMAQRDSTQKETFLSKILIVLDDITTLSMKLIYNHFNNQKQLSIVIPGAKELVLAQLLHVFSRFREKIIHKYQSDQDKIQLKQSSLPTTTITAAAATANEDDTKQINQIKTILISWYNDHIENPIPNYEQKQLLIRDTGLSEYEINYWLIHLRSSHIISSSSSSSAAVVQ